MRVPVFLISVAFLLSCGRAPDPPREKMLFTGDWKFYPGDDSLAFLPDYDDSGWRVLDLPHDWSIEGDFSRDHPGGTAQGALPTGIGWYRKTFPALDSSRSQRWYIDFDGVYRNSDVWINGQHLGNRGSGYASFRYDLTPYLNYGEEENILAVRADNSLQPHSRWYTGSGIYRNVWLVRTTGIHVAHWGSFIRTPLIEKNSALIELDLEIRNHTGHAINLSVETDIYNAEGKKILRVRDPLETGTGLASLTQKAEIPDPELWSPKTPVLYRAITRVFQNGIEMDRYETGFGIRYFDFDPANGFSLNGEPLKLYGANQHHDLGALGAAVNTRAIKRQLEILKSMGCNALRSAHNLPAPELLDLCDRMGLLVMDECFDVWARRKAPRYGPVDWEEWHTRDIQDMVLRDRNHPCVFMWSLGNEIPEQFDSSGTRIARELAETVRALDNTRPLTAALTEQDPSLNHIYRSGELDVISFNYKHYQYKEFPENYPGEKMLAGESVSALATRGHYDMPSDSVRSWPLEYGVPFTDGNPDYTASAYDNAHAKWGTTHEANWDVIQGEDFISGMFLWAGFDYLGEPDPYPWPARSSYLGVIDLAGFPKDAYYLYQSLWTDKEVLHVFPHWNWEPGQIVDIWAYYNKADELELFLNGESKGIRRKKEGEYHVMWRLPFEAGSIRVVKKRAGVTVQQQEIRTAGSPHKIELSPDREKIRADGRDLSFIRVQVLDEDGNLCPTASNLVRFSVEGTGKIAGVDNGYQASLEPFKGDRRKAFNGICLLIVQSAGEQGDIRVEAVSEGLISDELVIETR